MMAVIFEGIPRMAAVRPISTSPPASGRRRCCATMGSPRAEAPDDSLRCMAGIDDQSSAMVTVIVGPPGTTTGGGSP